MLGGADLGSLSVEGGQVGEQVEPIELHGHHDVVCPAVFNEVACGANLGVQGVEGDDPPGEGEPRGEGANGGDLVALVGDGLLSEDQPAAVFGGGDEDVLPLGVVTRGAADVLATSRGRSLNAPACWRASR